MKMRLRPLREQTYESTRGPVRFLEQTIDDHCKVIINNGLVMISMSELELPIIDTKDYEKIEDKKHKVN